MSMSGEALRWHTSPLPSGAGHGPMMSIVVVSSDMTICGIKRNNAEARAGTMAVNGWKARSLESLRRSLAPATTRCRAKTLPRSTSSGWQGTRSPRSSAGASGDTIWPTWWTRSSRAGVDHLQEPRGPGGQGHRFPGCSRSPGLRPPQDLVILGKCEILILDSQYWPNSLTEPRKKRTVLGPHPGCSGLSDFGHLQGGDSGGLESMYLFVHFVLVQPPADAGN